MYGGLFGDLPATKGSSTNNDDDKDNDNNDKNKNDDNAKSKAGKSMKRSSANVSSQSTNESSKKFSMFMPTAARKSTKSSVSTTSGKTKTNDDKTTVKKQKIGPNSSHILQTIGTAGTSMAFVPTAALKQRSKQPTGNRFVPKSVSAPSSQLPSITSASSKSSTNIPEISNNDNVNSSIGINNQNDDGESTSQKTQVSLNSSSSTPQISSLAVSSTYQTQVISTKSKKGHQSAAVVQNIHKIDNGTDENLASAIKSHSLSKRGSSGNTGDDNYTHSINDDDDDYHHVKATEIVTDPYDPYVPNDLLQYWDRKAIAQERAEMEREAQEALEKQRLLREQLEREREELQRQGDYDTLLSKQQGRQGQGDEHGNYGDDRNDNRRQPQQPEAILSGAGRGRGRGRGVSNLPAWLVEKQRREQQLGKG